MALVAVGPLPGSQQLFNRVAQLTVGLASVSGAPNTDPPGTALQITGLRIQAKIKRSVRPEPGTAEISVYNLNAAHRAQLRVRGLPIILAAGYTNTIAQIFEGQIRYADSVRHGPDWVTKIQCGDGEVSYRLARLTQAWGAGTSVRQVVQALVNILGPSTTLTTSTIATIPGQFPRGYNVNGPAANALTDILGQRGFEWHFYNGKVVLIPQGATTNETAVLLSPTTGLVGSPEHGTSEPGAPAGSTHLLKVKALLTPTLRVAGLVQVQADGIGATTPAFFRVQKLEDEIDTQSGPFYSSVECSPV